MMPDITLETLTFFFLFFKGPITFASYSGVFIVHRILCWSAVVTRRLPSSLLLGFSVLNLRDLLLI